nr:plasmid pRiA4b ORF-3 family protein [Clostridium beijerinckii]
MNFKELHEILQISFGWKNYNLYEFNVINEEGDKVLNVTSEHEEMKRWSDINWNKNFCMDLVNRRLKYALRN